MSTLKSPEPVSASDFERELRERLLRKKSGKAESSKELSVTDDASVGVSSLVSEISAQSIENVNRLIAGLQGMRKKLDDTRDRIQRDISQHAAHSQAVIELTKIVSDAMLSIDKPAVTEVASPNVSPTEQPEE